MRAAAAATARIYRSRHIRRPRRTKREIEVLRESIYELVAEFQPVTCRQVFYQLVSLGVIGKTENEYSSTVVRLLGQMRREGVLPYGWIADNTRWMRRPRTHDNMTELLEDAARTYRRDLWRNQDAYVEVWLEKDALAGVLLEETAPYQVPLMVTRGYASLSFLHSAAESIEWEEKPAYLYYFGDHDPSGVDIPRKVEATLRDLAPDADIHFERVAVTEEQIQEWHLPTRPTKRTDTRARNFRGDSVEVDAIPPDLLRTLTRECIEQHIDERSLEETRRIERLERETLRSIAVGALRGGA